MIAPAMVRKILRKYNLKAKVYNKNVVFPTNRVERISFAEQSGIKNRQKMSQTGGILFLTKR